MTNTDNQLPADEVSTVRSEFVVGYANLWNCTPGYAEEMMQNIEREAGEDALAAFYQQLCHMHTGVLLTHGGQVAQGLALAVVAIQELIPAEKKQAAIVEFAEGSARSAK